MKSFDEIIKNKWTIPIVCLIVVLIFSYYMSSTSPEPEKPQEPPSIPLSKPRVRPGIVIYSDGLPKPVQQTSPDTPRPSTTPTR